MTDAILKQWLLGHLMRTYRKAAGISQIAAAQAIDVSSQTIGRFEDGTASKIPSLHVEVLCTAYSAGDQERSVLVSSARDVHKSRSAITRDGRAVPSMH